MLSDPDMKSLAEEEIKAAKVKLEDLDGALQRLLLPRGSRTTAAACSWKSAPAQAATKARCSPATCCACIRAMPDGQGWRVELMSGKPLRAGRLQGSDRPHRRRRRLWAAEVRVRRAPRAARAGHRGAGPHPYVGVHGGGHARKPTRWARSSSTRPTCASTPSAPAAPAGSTSTKPIRRCASPTLPTGLVVECQDDRSPAPQQGQGHAGAGGAG